MPDPKRASTVITAPAQPASKPPAWWQQQAQQYAQQNGKRLSTFGNVTGRGGGSVYMDPELRYQDAALQQQHNYFETQRQRAGVPGVNTFTSQQADVVRTPQGTTQTNISRESPPAWLGNTRMVPGGTPSRSQNKPTQNIPTSTFLSQGGDMAQAPTGAPTPTYTPPNSFQSGGGQFVMGPNGLPYYVGTPGPNTFIAAGGDAVRGPDYGWTPPTTAGGGGGGGGGGFGSRYKGWGNNGGGYGGSNYIPSWLMGLYSWNFKS